MPTPILELRDIRRRFPVGETYVDALRGVSFLVTQGEFTTIMGSSGSGKTTLLNMLGAMDKPTAGQYLLDGVAVQDLNNNQLAAIRNRKIGYVFQAFHLLSRSTALENVELPLLYNSSINSKERKERAAHALDLVSLSNRMDHHPNQLSGGQQQRVAIARALVADPVLILADEATGNLDSKTSYEIMDLFQKLNGQGKTIVFVTHEPDIARFSQRTLILKDGLLNEDIKRDAPLIAKDFL